MLVLVPMVVVVLVVVLVLCLVPDHLHARLDLPLGEQPPLQQQPLERGEPALVVAPLAALVGAALPGGDLGDQRLAEPLPGERLPLGERERDPEGAALPGGGEHELAVRARRRRRPGGLLRERSGERARAAHLPRRRGRPVPIIESRVTSAASSCSERPSVPAGRSGSTK